MKTQVTFQSAKFPADPDEEDLINPGLWGRKLARYLVQKLAAEGIATGEPVAEDWGWMIPVHDEGPHPVALCCGHQHGDDDEFLCFTEPATPVVRKLFRKVDVTPQLARLTAALQKILAADPEITGVVWSEPG